MGFMLKITNVTTATIATGPWPSEVPKDYEWLLVFLETDEGITGIGETRGGLRTEISIEEAKPILMDEDPTNINSMQLKN